MLLLRLLVSNARLLVVLLRLLLRLQRRGLEDHERLLLLHLHLHLHLRLLRRRGRRRRDAHASFEREGSGELRAAVRRIAGVIAAAPSDHRGGT